MSWMAWYVVMLPIVVCVLTAWMSLRVVHAIDAAGERVTKAINAVEQRINYYGAALTSEVANQRYATSELCEKISLEIETREARRKRLDPAYAARTAAEKVVKPILERAARTAVEVVQEGGTELTLSGDDIDTIVDVMLEELTDSGVAVTALVPAQNTAS